MAAPPESFDKKLLSSPCDVPEDASTMLTLYDGIETTPHKGRIQKTDMYNAFTPSYVGKQETPLDGDTDIATVSLASSDVGVYAQGLTMAPWPFSTDDYDLQPSMFGMLSSFYSLEEKDATKISQAHPYADLSTASTVKDEETYPEEPPKFTRDQYFKTKMCPFYMRRECLRGDACSFAHTRAELQSINDLKKTRLCRNWQKNQCNRTNCPYAHGFEELRHTGDYYKTSICVFWLNGDCPLKDLCRHAHGKEELRGRSYRWTERQKGRMQKRKQFLIRRRGLDSVETWKTISPLPEKEDVMLMNEDVALPPPSRTQEEEKMPTSLISSAQTSARFQNAFSSSSSFPAQSLYPNLPYSQPFSAPPLGPRGEDQQTTAHHPLSLAATDEYFPSSAAYTTFPYDNFPWPPHAAPAGEAVEHSFAHLSSLFVPDSSTPEGKSPLTLPEGVVTTASSSSNKSDLHPLKDLPATHFPSRVFSREMLQYFSSGGGMFPSFREEDLALNDTSYLHDPLLPSYPHLTHSGNGDNFVTVKKDDLLENTALWEDSFLHKASPLVEETWRPLERVEGEGGKVEYAGCESDGGCSGPVIFSPSLSATTTPSPPPYPLRVHSHPVCLPASPLSLSPYTPAFITSSVSKINPASPFQKAEALNSFTQGETYSCSTFTSSLPSQGVGASINHSEPQPLFLSNSLEIGSDDAPEITWKGGSDSAICGDQAGDKTMPLPTAATSSPFKVLMPFSESQSASPPSHLSQQFQQFPFTPPNAVSGIIQSMVESVIHDEKAATMVEHNTPASTSPAVVTADATAPSTTTPPAPRIFASCFNDFPPAMVENNVSKSFTSMYHTDSPVSFLSYAEDSTTAFTRDYPNYIQRKGMEVV